jgi:phosphate transport system permease protein
MNTTDVVFATEPTAPSEAFGRRNIPKIAEKLVLVVALALGALAWILLGGAFVAGLTALVAYLVILPLWALMVDGKRSAVDHLTTGLIWSAFLVAVVPLVWLSEMVISHGAKTVTPEFLTYSMRNVLGDAQGGLYHALMGTLIITGIALAISVPIGIFAAIYLIEYGNKNRISRAITFLVDVMTGIPSIVAGLFAFALFALVFGPGTRIGLGGAVALSLLMVPTVVRTTEEMLRLVPNDLREAAYALGVPKWRTITKVVLPTAVGGIVTGIMLAISRVIGETAPLLVAAGFTNSVNVDPLHDSMMTLPVFIFTQYSQATPKGEAYAWGGALVLITLVMLLNLVARIVGKIFAPKTGH